MSKEKDDKKGLLEWISGVIPKIFMFQAKAQLAEEARLQGVENVKIENLNVNINIGDTTHNIKPQFPPDADPQAIFKVLQVLTPKEPPKLSGFEFPQGKDIKWITDNLTTAVNSSAATLSTMATTEFYGDFWENLILPKDEEGEGT
jgi:hypothetical protein